MLLSLMLAAFLAVPASQAMADVLTVSLASVEGGTGTVKSQPAGIECSNTPGAEKLSVDDCSGTFGTFATVKLTAIPDGGHLFISWSGNTPHFPEFGFPSSCNSGSKNPCSYTAIGEEVGQPNAQVTATFRSLPDPPIAITGPVQSIDYPQATLTGEVNPDGFPPAECYFEYGLTEDYGEKTTCIQDLGEGSAFVPVSAATEALEPSATYHYRIVAVNPGGDSKGEDKTFTTPAGPPDACSNAAVRAEQGIRALRLPRCMAFEMVSPPVKFNQYARRGQISADGDSVYFESVAALADTPKQGEISEKYVSSRTSSGWKTYSTAPPVEYVRGYDNVAQPCSYKPDFSAWSTFASTQTQAMVGLTTALRSPVGGPFSAFGPTIEPIGSLPTGEGVFNVNGGACAGSSTDLSRLFLSIGIFSYLPGDPQGSPLRNTYEVYSDEGTPSIRLLQRDGNGVVIGGPCGARVGGAGGTVKNNRFFRGAVSPDASRVYISTYPQLTGQASCASPTNLRILKRVDTPSGPWISELATSECTRTSPACASANGNDEYQAASLEGDKVLFKTTRQLANSDTDSGSQCGSATAAGCDLYLYDASRPFGQRLTQISAGEEAAPTPGAGAEVLGLADLGGDASHVYFVARGILTTEPNSEGSFATAGQPNLYLYQRDGAYPQGRTVFIGRLSSSIDSGIWIAGPEGALTMAVPVLGAEATNQGVGGDGNVLVFESAASLTADDTDGGKGDAFRFDAATETLERISKAAPGGSDNGSFDTFDEARAIVPPGPQRFSVGRWVSEDGETIVFSTVEALDPLDQNGKENAYIWHEGEVMALPYAFFPALSMSGEEVAFTSFLRLVPGDGDGSSDVYVARVGGGFPVPPPPEPCRAEACQEPFRAQPPAPASSSDSFAGSGNIKEKPKSKRKGKSKKRKKPHRKQRNRAGHQQGGQK